MALPARPLELDQPVAPAMPPPAEQPDPRLSAREIIARLRAAVQQGNGETVARSIGIHRGTLGRIIDGTAALSDSIRAKVLEWFRVEDLRLRDEAAGLSAGRLVKTSIARHLADVVTVCQVQHGIGLIQGPAGVGKTRAAMWLCRSNPSAIYINVSAATNSPSRMLEALWFAAGFRHRRSVPRKIIAPADMPGGRANRAAWTNKRGISRGMRSIRMQHCDLVEAWRVPEGTVSNRVVIIDQAHLLKDAAIDELQAIHDETGVAIVLLATNRFERFDAGGGDRQMYEQWVSRICCRRSFIHVHAEDVERVARAYMPPDAGLTEAGRRFLVALAAGPRSGGLRAVAWNVQLAYKLDRFSPRKGDALDERHLRAAHEFQIARPIRPGDPA